MAEISLRQLRSLVVLAEELHFRRAAARLHLTQPALSHQISQLEETLGVRLFDREHRRVALNPAGESLAGDSRRLLAELDRALSAARHTAVPVPPLHVCHSPSIRRVLIPRLAERLHRVPELDVMWVEHSEEVAGLELLNGRYDVVLGRFPPLERGLEHTVLLWERPGVYLSHSDPLAALDEVPLPMLAGRRIRTVRPEAVPRHFETTRRDLAAAGLEREIAPTMSYANWDSAELRHEIHTGRCVLIGLASARGALADVTVVPLAAPATPIPVTMCWRVGETRDDIRDFVARVRALADDIDEPWTVPGPAALLA